MNAIKITLRLESISSDLSRLLKMSFVPSHAASNSRIGKSLASIIPLWNSGRAEDCEIELLRLEFLAKHLKEIESFNPNLLRHFCTEFRRAGSETTSYGVRFEAYVAASLIRRGVKFEKSEAPDFIISGSSLGIECTSLRVTGQSDKSEYIYKIGSAFKKKSGTDSNKPEVALLIDATNIAFNSRILDTSDIRLATEEALSKHDFGAAVVFMYLFNHDLKRLEANYIRVISSKTPKLLHEFLDIMFPVTGHEVHSHKFLQEG